MNSLSEKALIFATKKHKGQKRKYGEDDYIIHPVRVAKSLEEIDDIDLYCAALLHDTLEDTDTTYEEIKSEFNKKIADLVVELTNDELKIKDLGKTVHHKEKLEKISSNALLIKLLDIYDNLKSCLKNTPDDFKKKQYNMYIYLINNLWDTRKMEKRHLDVCIKIYDVLDNIK